MSTSFRRPRARRTPVQGAAALSLLALLFTGCTSAVEQSERGDAAASTCEDGGTLVMANSAAPEPGRVFTGSAGNITWVRVNVPVTSLFRGAETERPASFVKAGSGTPIVRNGTQVGHGYQLLGGLRGEHKRLECLLVTLNDKSEAYPLFQHPGTEFIYMLDGAMDYGHSRSTYRLEPGDSLQIDGEGAHGPVDLIDLPIRFLSVIAFPDAAV